MDIVGDYANLRGIDGEEALNATLPWMLHCLHRQEVSRAIAATVAARAVHVAVAPTMGCEGGARLLQAFYSEMASVIRADPFAAPDDGRYGPTAEEIAFFERIEREALANKPKP